MSKRPRQQGLTIVGFVLVAAVVAVFVVVGARMVPAYIEYNSVKKSIEKSLNDVRDPGSTMEVRRAFEKYLATDYIDSVRASDLEITKEGTQTTASVAWTRILPLAGNVSLYLEFEAKATR
jgi:Tfp pilus assembly protein PilE